MMRSSIVTDMTSLTIPDSVTSIGSSAFINCTGLTSVTIGNGVTNIGQAAFATCSGLTSVTIGNSVTTIADWAFRRCSESLFDTTSIPGVKLVDGWAVGHTGSLPSDLDLTGIRGIGNTAFMNCTGLTSVTIPDSVTNIGGGAFSGCSGLACIFFDGNAPAATLAFANVSSDCTAYVKRGSTGWGVEIPGIWNGIRIEYIDGGEPGVPGGGTGGDDPDPEPELAPFPALAFTAAKAKVLDGAVYNAAGKVAGMIQLKVAKPNAKKRTAKVSGSVTLLDGRKRSMKAATANVPADAPVGADIAIKGLGTLSVQIGNDGFAGTIGTYTVRSAKVGGKWPDTPAGVTVDFATGGSLPPGTLEPLLPNGVPVRIKGGKWVFEKAAAVKLMKGELVTDTAKGQTNLPSLKLTYTAKTGLFKGSFKLYAIQGGKLKKFTVKVTGVVVENAGAGVAKLAKPAATWNVAVE